METTIAALSAEHLRGVAVSAIITKALVIVGLGYDRWKIYEIAKCAIADFTESADEYQQAIKLLTEALNV